MGNVTIMYLWHYECQHSMINFLWLPIAVTCSWGSHCHDALWERFRVKVNLHRKTCDVGNVYCPGMLPLDRAREFTAEVLIKARCWAYIPQLLGKRKAVFHMYSHSLEHSKYLKELLNQIHCLEYNICKK